MSPKFFLLVTLSLIALVDKSESITCYDCESKIDGDNCHNAISLKEKYCPLQEYCYTVKGMRMWFSLWF